MVRDDDIVDEDVTDEATKNEEEIPYKYAVTSYGADYPVESIVKKLEKESIIIPFFQREYVWTHVEASRFVESLLLGLPVPGIFLSKKEETQNLLVIDGHQRLRTLQYFYDGIFRQGPSKDKAFTLKNVQPQYEGQSYKELLKEDKLRLDDSIIHATIVKQDNPEGDESSIYHIFERLNTGGRQLYPQEIRNCIYFGEFNELLQELNNDPQWREFFGKENARQKDRELILRFFAMLFFSDKYKRPMKGFLNSYMAKNRHLKFNPSSELKDIFIKTISIINESIPNPFRPERTLNAAVFDAVMTGVATRIKKKYPITDKATLKSKYNKLLNDQDFIKAYKTGTSDAESVNTRLSLAKKAFDDIP